MGKNKILTRLDHVNTLILNNSYHCITNSHDQGSITKRYEK